MGSTCTLRIRHFPPELSHTEIQDILTHFGAVHVETLSSKLKKNNTTFARFESEATSTAALHRLHQLDVLGYPLNVEYARGVKNEVFSVDQKQDLCETKEEKEDGHKYLQAFLQKLNTWHAGVNLMQPPPPHLKYQYPPPTQAVLSNICRALAAVPKFYTQVLHLMNKMNLPCPFEPVFFPEVDVLPSVIKMRDDKVLPSVDSIQTVDSAEEEEEEESELESDGEGQQLPTDIIPEKRSLPQKTKKVKRPKFIKPMLTGTVTMAKSVKPEDVFEKVTREPTQRKIELKLSAAGEGETITDNTDEKITLASGGFGLMFPMMKEADETAASVNTGNGEEEIQKSDTITEEELANNRVSSRDQKHLPVFRNYQPGIPSCRLYIKNLAKHVTERDLHFIYRRYLIPSYEEQGSMFDVRLMTEGRMKGQAFITLQSVKQAEVALKETNGYILKDKPLVVQFARSAKAK